MGMYLPEGHRVVSMLGLLLADLDGQWPTAMPTKDCSCLPYLLSHLAHGLMLQNVTD
jgi:hypothetical protein